MKFIPFCQLRWFFQLRLSPVRAQSFAVCEGRSLHTVTAKRLMVEARACFGTPAQPMGEAQQASKAANDREAKLMAEKAAAPVAKRTRLGLGTTWQPKVSNNRAIIKCVAGSMKESKELDPSLSFGHSRDGTGRRWNGEAGNSILCCCSCLVREGVLEHPHSERW